MERARSEIPGCELTLTAETVLEVRELTKHFPVYEKGVILRRKLGDVHAVDQVSFEIKKNETFGLVGESGCGKTTIAKCMLYLEPPTLGNIFFNGKNVTEIFKKGKKDQVLALRRQMQYIFQNPYSSLDPRMTVADIIMEPLEVHQHIPRNQWQDRMYELLRMVGLEDYHAERYPHEFSGGQRQRVCIARALAVDPQFIAADEPVASLDVSVRAQILNLLQELQQKLGITYLYISHDLSTVRLLEGRATTFGSSAGPLVGLPQPVAFQTARFLVSIQGPNHSSLSQLVNPEILSMSNSETV